MLSMGYEFVIRLEKENNPYINRVSFLLCLLSIISFVFFQLQDGEWNSFQLFAISIISFSILSDMGLIGKNPKRAFSNSLFVTGICWLGMHRQQWLCMPYFLMGI